MKISDLTAEMVGERVVVTRTGQSARIVLTSDGTPGIWEDCRTKWIGEPTSDPDVDIAIV